MSVDLQERTREIFMAAVERPAEDRAAFLDDACGDDTELRACVGSMLAAHEDAGEFLGHPTVEIGRVNLGATPAASMAASMATSMDEVIGHYRILQKLGEGGMGEVFLVEQEQPIHRRAAMKVIKSGMDSRQVVARFESERQALAMMDHPCIARVFDAGTTGRGRPYFVMEHVKGVPITDYCDTHRLDTEQRLDLFMQVCDGIQHAHHKAVIHRDIKPSNILVTVQGDTPVPKIIDFGVAKATAQPLTDRTMVTEIGQLIGTPEYMSPEQAEMSGQNIDTRTDVYALGVLLYELLVGAQPFSSQELRSGGYDEIRRRIREDDPPRPSTRLSSLGDSATDVCRNRRLDAHRLMSRLKGDLDWITMRAMEKDRTRRYGSPAELAEDVRRHLDNQPVAAGPPSARYRLGKFARRHRIGMTIVSGLLVLLIAFAAAMTFQAKRVTRQRDRAIAAETLAQTVNDFLTIDLLGAADPMQESDRDLTVRELLDTASARIRERFEEDSLASTAIHLTVGRVYRELAELDKAEMHLTEALRIAERLDDEGSHTITAMSELALLYIDQGRLDEAEPLLVSALLLNRTLHGNEHVTTLDCMGHLASVHYKRGDMDRAIATYREVLPVARVTLGPDHETTLGVMSSLALILDRTGHADEAEPIGLDAIEGYTRSLGAEHPFTLTSRNNLALLYARQDRFDEAEPIFLEVMAIRRRTLGDDHTDTLVSMATLARAYRDQERYEEAEPLALDAYRTLHTKLGGDHTYTTIALDILVTMYEAWGRPDDVTRWQAERSGE